MKTNKTEEETRMREISRKHIKIKNIDTRNKYISVVKINIKDLNL